MLLHRRSALPDSSGVPTRPACAGYSLPNTALDLGPFQALEDAPSVKRDEMSCPDIRILDRSNGAPSLMHSPAGVDMSHGWLRRLRSGGVGLAFVLGLLIAGVFITVNLLTDIAYVVLDPRLRQASR